MNKRKFVKAEKILKGSQVRISSYEKLDQTFPFPREILSKILCYSSDLYVSISETCYSINLQVLVMLSALDLFKHVRYIITKGFSKKTISLINYNRCKVLIPFVDINTKYYRDIYCRTILYDACFKNNIKIVKLLVESGVDLNLKISKSPLCAAWNNKNKDLMRYLIDNGADPNDSGYVNPVLILSCLDGDLSIAKLLIESGANVNVKSEYGRTPLIIVAHSENLQIFQLLMQNRDTKLKEKAMRIVCMKGNLQMFDICVSQDLDLQTTDNNGNSLLHYAAKCKNPSFVETFISKYNFDPCLENQDGKYPVEFVTDPSVFQVFLKYNSKEHIENTIQDIKNTSFLINIYQLKNAPKDYIASLFHKRKISEDVYKIMKLRKCKSLDEPNCIWLNDLFKPGSRYLNLKYPEETILQDQQVDRYFSFLFKEPNTNSWLERDILKYLENKKVIVTSTFTGELDGLKGGSIISTLQSMKTIYIYRRNNPVRKKMDLKYVNPSLLSKYDLSLPKKF